MIITYNTITLAITITFYNISITTYTTTYNTTYSTTSSITSRVRAPISNTYNITIILA